jgi:hypothetical protein
MRKGIGSAVLAALIVLLSTAGGCADGRVKSIPPGKHPVTKSLRGYWQAKDAVQGCKWTLQTKDGSVLQRGVWTLKNRTQAVLLGTGNLGMIFWPNDACGTWT